MVVFEEFFKTSTDPNRIEYKGKVLVGADYLPVRDGDIFRVTIESSDSEWKQGIRLRLDRGFIVVNDQRIPGQTGIVLWEDTCPGSVEFQVDLQGAEGVLIVYNAWDTGTGTVDAWHNGAAMLVQSIPEGRRYYCNDGHPDDDLNDLVFRIENTRGLDPML